MLQLELAVAVELCLVLEGHHAEGIPVAEGRHSTELLGRVEASCGKHALAIVEGRNVAGRQLVDRGLASEAVLDNHRRERNHRQTAVVQLRRQLFLRSPGSW